MTNSPERVYFTARGAPFKKEFACPASQTPKVELARAGGDEPASSEEEWPSEEEWEEVDGSSQRRGVSRQADS